MPRKKKQNTEIENNDDQEKHFTYCEYLKCPHTECLRHDRNTPFNVVINRRKFNPDKEWNCKNIVKE